MLSIGTVAPGGAGYYLDRARGAGEGYYTAASEPAGVWVGAAAGALGVAGEVTSGDLAAVLDGRHPARDVRLVPGGRDRVGGLDLTFSAPKSVSLLWGLHPDPAVRDAVVAAQHRAVADGLGYLERHAARARRGRGGRERVAVTGLAGAAFDHRTSRAGDPQLHTHVVVANMVCDHTGRWSAPDGRALYRHARTAGHVYQARLRHELTERLGVTWGPVRAGQADLAGVPRAAIDAFSGRRHQVVAALDARGLSSSRAARVATLDTRPAKPAPGTDGDLEARWAQTAAAVGLDVTGLAGPGRAPLAVDADRLTDRLVGADGLTANRSAFDRRAVVTELAAAHPEGATLEHLDAVADRVTADVRVVDLGPALPAAVEGRWTTVDLIAVEADLLRRAENGPSVTAGRVPDAVLDRAIDRALGDRPHLADEQAATVRSVCASRDPVLAVIGRPGTGKTFTLDAARNAWSFAGVPVVGAALAARAAAELQAGSGIPSTTLARLLGDMTRPEGRLTAGTVVVVDEAGMVGTRDLHRLITLAGDQQARVVLVGDDRQLPEIAAGGAFSRLCRSVPSSELTVNRRQAKGWERDALDRLRDRQPSAALARYGAAGRITLADTAPELRDRMVADWHAERSSGAQVAMLAVRRADVDDLNSRAQAALAATGALDAAGPSVDLGEDRRALIGDEVVCRRNDRRSGLVNGTRLTVTGIDADHSTGRTRSIAGKDQSGATVTVPGGYAAEGHVELGYASTVHKAQGRTVDVALLLGDDRLFAEAGYVGLSRGREANRLYVVADHHPLDHRPDLPGRGLADHLCRALGTSRSQTMATGQVSAGLPDRPLPNLVAERDTLRDRLLASMPPGASVPTRPGATPADVVGRDRWTAEHRRDGERLARLAATVDRRVERLGLAATIDPPPHFERLLGPAPDTGSTRRVWAHTAGAVEAWREMSGRRPDGSTRDLLAEPRASDPSHLWWAQAVRALDGHHRHLADRSPAHQPDRDPDRSWRPAQQKGLSL